MEGENRLRLNAGSRHQRDSHADSEDAAPLSPARLGSWLRSLPTTAASSVFGASAPPTPVRGRRARISLGYPSNFGDDDDDDDAYNDDDYNSYNSHDDNADNAMGDDYNDEHNDDGEEDDHYLSYRDESRRTNEQSPIRQLMKRLGGLEANSSRQPPRHNRFDHPQSSHRQLNHVPRGRHAHTSSGYDDFIGNLRAPPGSLGQLGSHGNSSGNSYSDSNLTCNDRHRYNRGQNYSPGHCVRISNASATTTTTNSVVLTDCVYHISSLCSPPHWVGSLRLASSAGFRFDDVSAEQMNATVKAMMVDWKTTRWEEVALPGLRQTVWRGTRHVDFDLGDGEGDGHGSGQGEKLPGVMVVFAPMQALKLGFTGGVRIKLCHKMSIDCNGDRLASGLFLRHRDPQTMEWTWMVFDGFPRHPDLEPATTLREIL